MNVNPSERDCYGDDFQEKSKYKKGKLPQHDLNWPNKPKQYKDYENALFRVVLPKLEFNTGIEFWKTLLNRHSTRSYSKIPLTLKELGFLLFGMCGLTRKYPDYAFRTTPSAGGLYPIEVYPIVNNVEKLKEGIYHYDIKNHALECLKEGDFKAKTCDACLGQKMVLNSAVNFAWTAIIARSEWKYLQRCYRYIYLDCGHIAQNFCLVAEALNLGACTIGALYDDELNAILGIDGINETIIYVGVVGNIK
ncbi:MAG: SagB/ThcOx family dehydrogenase [Candidatus Lokiarchaeota archaeon]|nr:SagB/ThcOx family dehydrogenase [Candidatus Lokiarchaeota archaeon]